MPKCTLFVYIIIQLAPFVNPQKKVANVTTFNPFLSRGTYLSSVGFITVPSNTPEGKKRVPKALSFGGGKGIRTLVRLLSNGFQVYASIVYLPSYSPAQYRKNQGYTMASRTK